MIAGATGQGASLKGAGLDGWSMAGESARMEPCQLIYCTCPDAATARSLAWPLVEEGLVACANILPTLESCYIWQGKVETATEAVMLLKTRAALVDQVIARVAAAHPAEIPCIVALPITTGHRPFLDWVGANTHGA